METVELKDPKFINIDDDELLETARLKGSQTIPLDDDDDEEELLTLQRENTLGSESLVDGDEHLEFNASDFDEDEEELLVMEEGEEEEDDQGYDDDHMEVDESVASEAQRPYQRNSEKAVYNVKGLSLTLSELKLYGLVKKKEGKFVMPKCADAYSHDLTNLKFVKKLTNPASKVQRKIITDDDIHCTFKPKKDAKALRAMKNHRCGYDFLSNEDNSNFLQRVGNTSKKSQIKKEKYLEADYEAKLNKLVCPKCKKQQSYVEYKERVRECRSCNKRFGPSAVMDQERFENKLKAHETKRLGKLAEVEKTMYDFEPFRARPAPKVMSPARSSGESIDSKGILATKTSSALPPLTSSNEVEINWSKKPDLNKLLTTMNDKPSIAPPSATINQYNYRADSSVHSARGSPSNSARSGDQQVESKKSSTDDVRKVNQADSKQVGCRKDGKLELSKENDRENNTDRLSFEFDISIDHLPVEPPSSVKAPDYKLPATEKGGDSRSSSFNTKTMKGTGAAGKTSISLSSDNEDLNDGYVYEAKFGELLEQRY